MSARSLNPTMSGSTKRQTPNSLSHFMYLSQTPLKQEENRAVGRFVDRYGNRFLRIEHADQMPPLFMSLVSHSDHWMFISSSGGLSAGRGRRQYALPVLYRRQDHSGSFPGRGRSPLCVFRKEGRPISLASFLQQVRRHLPHRSAPEQERLGK